MTTPFTLEAPATSNFNMTSDIEFGTLTLLALGWETKDRRLIPNFSKVLSTIAEVSLACGLMSPNHIPASGFQFVIVEREDLSDELIKEMSMEEGDEWLGRYVYGKASPRQSADPLDQAAAGMNALAESTPAMPLGIVIHLGRCRQTAEYLKIPPGDLVQLFGNTVTYF
jgi:hypothetical protein